DRDTAQHTLEECPAWDQERHLLISHVGRDLSPAAVIAAMLAEDRAWKAVAFCETVLVKKEAAERDRERANPARRRQRPTGARVRRRRSEGGWLKTSASLSSMQLY
ncbi:jg1815, partial [Pararge aegeria aegeria]